jgi:hypothetical protein
MKKVLIIWAVGAVLTSALDAVLGIHFDNFVVNVVHKVVYIGWGAVTFDVARRIR